MEKMGVKFVGHISEAVRRIANAHAEAVEAVTGKGVIYADLYEAAYRPGWCSGGYSEAVHSDYVSSIRELMDRIRYVRRCECAACQDVRRCECAACQEKASKK